MAPVGKAFGFYNEANDWFCNAGMPSDLTIVVDGVNFHLHKFPLLSRCGKIEKLIKETQNKDKGTCTIFLEDIPGGINAFLIAAKFCYGVPVELTPRNTVMVYCLADYLEMIGEYGDDNLFSKAESYFHKNVLKNWKDCVVVLQSCEAVITRADNLHITGKCLNAISTMVCTDPSLFGWPMMMYGSLQSPGGSILWNGIATGARIQSSESDWWVEDVSNLSLDLFQRLIKTMKAKGVQREKLTGAIMYYSGKCVHGLGRWQGGRITKTRTISSSGMKTNIVDQRVLVESMVKLLPETKGKSVCRFLLGFLRVALILGVSDKCRESLERRIGIQLELATLDGLMIPSYSDSDTLYNTDCVERMINCFLTSEQMETLPGSSRSLNDGLYRAFDIYFEAHPWLPEKEKERLCNIIDYQKLSVDACAHASQNKRLPLRIVLQVLFVEQMHIKTALSAIVPHGRTDTDAGSGMALVHENQVLRVGMEKMMVRVGELEQDLNKMRQEMVRMSQTHSSFGSPRFLAKKLGVCKLLARVSDAQRDVEGNGAATPRPSTDRPRTSHHSEHRKSFSIIL